MEEGYLSKRARRNKMWQQRWFELDRKAEKGPVLMWFKNKKDSRDSDREPSGVFECSSLKSIHLHVSSNQKDNLRRITIETTDQTLDVRAETRQEAELWVQLLAPFISPLSPHASGGSIAPLSPGQLSAQTSPQAGPLPMPSSPPAFHADLSRQYSAPLSQASSRRPSSQSTSPSRRSSMQGAAAPPLPPRPQTGLQPSRRLPRHDLMAQSSGALLMHPSASSWQAQHGPDPSSPSQSSASDSPARSPSASVEQRSSVGGMASHQLVPPPPPHNIGPQNVRSPMHGAAVSPMRKVHTPPRVDEVISSPGSAPALPARIRSPQPSGEPGVSRMSMPTMSMPQTNIGTAAVTSHQLVSPPSMQRRSSGGFSSQPVTSTQRRGSMPHSQSLTALPELPQMDPPKIPTNAELDPVTGLFRPKPPSSAPPPGVISRQPSLIPTHTFDASALGLVSPPLPSRPGSRSSSRLPSRNNSISHAPMVMSASSPLIVADLTPSPDSSRPCIHPDCHRQASHSKQWRGFCSVHFREVFASHAAMGKQDILQIISLGLPHSEHDVRSLSGMCSELIDVLLPEDQRQHLRAQLNEVANGPRLNTLRVLCACLNDVAVNDLACHCPRSSCPVFLVRVFWDMMPLVDRFHRLMQEPCAETREWAIKCIWRLFRLFHGLPQCERYNSLGKISVTKGVERMAEYLGEAAKAQVPDEASINLLLQLLTDEVSISPTAPYKSIDLFQSEMRNPIVLPWIFRSITLGPVSFRAGVLKNLYSVFAGKKKTALAMLEQEEWQLWLLQLLCDDDEVNKYLLGLIKLMHIYALQHWPECRFGFLLHTTLTALQRFTGGWTRASMGTARQILTSLMFTLKEQRTATSIRNDVSLRSWNNALRVVACALELVFYTDLDEEAASPQAEQANSPMWEPAAHMTSRWDSEDWDSDIFFETSFNGLLPYLTQSVQSGEYDATPVLHACVELLHALNLSTFVAKNHVEMTKEEVDDMDNAHKLYKLCKLVHEALGGKGSNAAGSLPLGTPLMQVNALMKGQREVLRWLAYLGMPSAGVQLQMNVLWDAKLRASSKTKQRELQFVLTANELFYCAPKRMGIGAVKLTRVPVPEITVQEQHNDPESFQLSTGREFFQIKTSSPQQCAEACAALRLAKSLCRVRAHATTYVGAGLFGLRQQLSPPVANYGSVEDPEQQLSATLGDEQEQDINMAPVWCDKKSVTCCAKCTTAFNLFKKKHHCRACGKVYCDTCTKNKIILKHIDTAAMQRVCDICLDLIKMNTVSSKKRLDRLMRSRSSKFQLVSKGVLKPEGKNESAGLPLARSRNKPQRMNTLNAKS